MAEALQIPSALLSDPLLLLAAHPDDETAGLGALLASRLQNDSPRERVAVAVLTDGVPLDATAIPAAPLGEAAWTDTSYRKRRHEELLAATSMLGLAAQDVYQASFRDQDLANQLNPALDFLLTLVRKYRPAHVLAPAYENGHPDHDACNVLATALHNRLKQKVRFWEYPLYRMAADGGLRYLEFADPAAAHPIWPAPEALQKKRTALECYRSQWETLKHFPLQPEWVRPLQLHDYSRPAAEGPAVWQSWGWPIAPARLSQLFTNFLAALPVGT